MTLLDPSRFYDELAEDYDLIFEDWEASMQRQGETLMSLLARYLGESSEPVQILDVAAGIGTQSLPLARMGCQVSSRDLSSAAIARLRREAASRGLSIDAIAADMRTIHTTVSQEFDAVIAFDNAVPHLLSDGDLETAFRSFYRCLRPGGMCLISVRDYDQVTRGADFVHAYGVRWRAGTRHLPLQAWRWVDADHYDLSFYIVVDETTSPRVRRTTVRYYAVPTRRLLSLLADVGFVECCRLDDAMYQPILVARRPDR